MQTPLTAQTTEERLLHAATRVFAESGFAGARVDEIARRARVNKAMIYYHFGTKRDLYRAVLTRLFGQVRHQMERIARSEADPARRLAAFYAQLIQLFESDPALPHILLREILAGGRHLHPEAARGFAGFLELIRGAVEEGIRAGRMRPVDPLLLHLTLMGPIALYFVSEPFRRRLLPTLAPGIAQPTTQGLRQHIETLLSGGLVYDIQHRS
jgi:TetR/AcrR family transcriptional regulator